MFDRGKLVETGDFWLWVILQSSSCPYPGTIASYVDSKLDAKLPKLTAITFKMRDSYPQPELDLLVSGT